MKLSYQQRTGHTRSKFPNKGVSATSRRKRVIASLEEQLVSGMKPANHKREREEGLTTEDVERIRKELYTLKQRV